MIVYCKHNEIDKKKWDDCILHSINSNAYAFSWFLDTVHEGWDALIEDNYSRVMPLTLKTKFGITYFLQPFFTQQLGVYSTDILNPAKVDEFITSIPSSVKLIDINVNHFNSIGNEKSNTIQNVNYLLDLIGDYNKLASGYSTNTKRNLKKSLKNNLSFVKGVKPEDIISLFRNNKGTEVGTWKDADYLVLRRLLYTAIHKGMGFTCGVYTEHNELCTGAFFLKTNSHLVFLFSGSNKIAKDVGAMTFLIDTVIKTNSPGTRILDFEGSNNQNLARFYKGFGSQKSEYSRLKINRLNFVFKFILNLIKKP